jgi:hypothetical protein
VASTSVPGIVQLNDTTTSVSISQALTARAGKNLQDQIGNLSLCTVPSRANVVAALNDLQAQTIELQTDALVWCGYYNALEGDITFVSITGQKLGYQIGQELPLPGVGNGGDFFIVIETGNPYAAGDFNAPDKVIEAGNWIISETVKWSEVKTISGLTATDISCFSIPPITANNVQGALTQITQLLRSGSTGGATVSINPPASPYQGQLWWDSERGYFYIYYRDPNGDQWVEIGGGGSEGLQSGSGSVSLIDTGVGLSGGPITTEGTIELVPATATTLGGFIPGRGLDYSVVTGLTAVDLSADYNAADPDIAFSQAGANALAAQIAALSGANVLAGTYDARAGLLVYATPAGVSQGFKAGEPLPAASRERDNYYVIVTVGGDFGPDGVQPSGAGDWWIIQAAELTVPVWLLIDFENLSASAENVSVNRIPGIDFATNVQTALEAIELQAQNRIETVLTSSDGINATVSDPGPDDNEGTVLTIGVDYSSLDQKGIVQLTDDITGGSQTLAVTQGAIAALNGKVEALTGANVLAGTYNANTGKVASVTPAGAANGFVVGVNAPDANRVRDNYYLIVIVSGGFGPPGALIPPGGIQAGDWFLNENESPFPAQWQTIDFENRSVAAENVSVSPIPGLSAVTVQGALEQIEDQVDQTITDIFSANDGLTITKILNKADFGFNSTIELNPATPTDIGGVFVAPNNGIFLSAAGGLGLDPATRTVIGGVKIGDGIDVTFDGTISVQIPDVGVEELTAGQGIVINPTTGVGIVNVSTPAATPSVLGGVKIGSGITVQTDGTISTVPATPPRKLDSLKGQFNGTATTFTLSIGGTPVTPANSSAVLIVLGGIVQTAEDAYTVSGSSITFVGEAPRIGTEFYGVYF